MSGDEMAGFELLARRVEPEGAVVGVRQLSGGVSAIVNAVELEFPDRRLETLVVRRHGEADLARNPRIAADEFTLLRRLRADGLPVPEPRYLDEAGEALGVPCLVVDYVEGEPPPVGAVQHVVARLAALLVRIHALDAERFSFLPRRELPRPRALGRNAPTLLHGDFWPGNTLWRNDEIVGVIDWEDAAIGDPLADVANARLELLWAYGEEAMEEFTRLYAAATAVDLVELPDWDLRAERRLTPQIGEWGLGEATVRAMRERRGAFVDQALDALRRD